jgi:hypothetical protein
MALIIETARDSDLPAVLAVLLNTTGSASNVTHI